MRRQHPANTLCSAAESAHLSLIDWFDMIPALQDLVILFVQLIV